MNTWWCVAACAVACSGGAAYGDQSYVLTGLGNLFAIHGDPAAPPGGASGMTVRIVPHAFDGFFLAGDRLHATALSFHHTYRIPAGAAADPGSVYAAVRDPHVNSIVANHGTYTYRNGHLELSTQGLDHVLSAMYGRVFAGSPSYWSGSEYVTFHGDGTAAYTLRFVTHNGKDVDDFLAHVVCYSQPCGTITAAKSRDDLMTFPGTLGQARLYDVVALGADPVIISEEHYIIANSTAGNLRVRAVPYDYDTFQIRGMPAGIAYTISELPSAGRAGGRAPQGCCHTPHEPVPAYRAGLQTGQGAISYYSDSLASAAGARHDVDVKTYSDVLWWSGRAAGSHLIFDYVNYNITRLPGPAGMAILPGAYIRVASSAGAALTDVRLAGSDCGGAPQFRMPHLSGVLPPGGGEYVPAAPGYGVLCVEMDGVEHAIPYRDMDGGAVAVPLPPRVYNGTAPPVPDASPCITCGHEMLQLRHDAGIYSHASVVAVRNGTMEVTVTGHGSYHSNTTRTWNTTHSAASVSHWAPSLMVRQDGSPTVSVYRNGALAEEVRSPCEMDSRFYSARTTQAGNAAHPYVWSHGHLYACEADVMSRVGVGVAAGDIIEVVLRVAPDMVYQTAGRDAAGAADAGNMAAKTGGTVLVSYR